MPNILTAPELAERWRCGTDSIYRLVKAGKLKAFKIGQDYRFTMSEVERYEEGGTGDE